MNWIEFATIAGVHFMAVASPGPDFAIAIKQALRYGTRTGVYTALGIGSGILLHVGLAVFGYAFLISEYAPARFIMQVIGGLFLIYIGIMSLRAKPFHAEAGLGNTAAIQSPGKAFRIGFLVNVVNVKATLFFLALYTSIVSPETGLKNQIIYGIYMAFATAAWFSLVSMLFGNKVVRSRFERYSHRIEHVTGVVLIALGIKLLFF